MEEKITPTKEAASIQEIINEAIKLGEALAGTSKVQAKRVELNLTDEQARIFWSAFHQARDLAYRTPRKRQSLTQEEKAKAKAIIRAQREETLTHLKAKYQGRNEFFGMKPVPTSVLRKWANEGTDLRSEYQLRKALASN